MSAGSLQGRRVWAEIDLAAVRRNAAVVRSKIGPDAALMAIVKANGYGHGVGPVTAALRDVAQMFGVANVREGAEVREAAPGAKVFILGPALPDEREEILRRGFIPSVSSLEEAAAYSRLAGAGTAEVHLVVDTGMGRIGFFEKEALDVVKELRGMRVKIAGLASHLPVADEDEAFTLGQLKSFADLARHLIEAGLDAPVIHSLNSAGVLRFPGFAAGMVRAGLMLYGSSPIPEFQRELRPALALKTRVTLVRAVPGGRGVSYGRTFITPGPMRIATLAIGYADGYQRHLSNRGAHVLIGGKRCPLLGRVTMDQVLADVSASPATAPGDESVLIGSQGDEEILAGELAEKAGTIAWEIFTGIGPRVERIYLHTEASSENG